MRMHFTLLFSFCLLCIGCSKQSSEPLNGEATGSVVGDALVGDSPDLSVPRLTPKPVIWNVDWSEPEEVSSDRKEAKELLSVADRLKAFEQYSEAEETYQKAMAADPSWGYPAYQLACNYELWGRHDKAVSMFQKAVELGVDDFPVALTDNELGRIRDRPDFEAALIKIRERYLANSKSRVGQPLAFRPDGDAPPDGWPMLLLLHGYGDTNLSYLDNAERWADLGFVAVAVPGSVPNSNGRYQWAMNSVDPTHQDLQAIIQSPLFTGVVNQNKIFLFGFSQGALHGMLLSVDHPDDYAGVIALSPGGSMAERLGDPRLNRTQAGRVVFIHGTEEPHAPFVEIWKDECQSSGWQFMSKTHPGGHHFPFDWEEMMPGIARFLIQ